MQRTVTLTDQFYMNGGYYVRLIYVNAFIIFSTVTLK